MPCHIYEAQLTSITFNLIIDEVMGVVIFVVIIIVILLKISLF